MNLLQLPGEIASTTVVIEMMYMAIYITVVITKLFALQFRVNKGKRTSIGSAATTGTAHGKEASEFGVPNLVVPVLSRLFIRKHGDGG